MRDCLSARKLGVFMQGFRDDFSLRKWCCPEAGGRKGILKINIGKPPLSLYIG
jgi:hypothetical protein